jgi:endonuclease/exonuclease/phosphatase family metal-dependent hydrolase
MLEFVEEQQADILCFQEFFESHNAKESPANIPYIRNQLHYPFYYFSPDHDRYAGLYEGGVIIFSKYPIIRTNHLKYRGLGADTLKAAESLITADIEVNGEPIRIFTTHLQSVMFRSKEFRDIEIIKNVDDSILPASKSIVKKLRNAYLQREEQADLVREELDNCPYPGIICGDFNDTPNSYTYFTIRGGWQDAFIKKGFGIGRTYVHISPTLRIDYILAHPAFKILQCKKFPLPYSDHNPVVADLELPGKKP